MKVRTPRARRTLTALGAVLTIVAAAVVWQNLPTPTDVTGPFDVHGEAGQPTAGRDIATTVTGARIAPQVNSVAATGIWVVVDVTVQAPRITALPKSDLIVGPNTYTPSDRFFLKTIAESVSPGIELTGSWVFDVAPGLVAPDATEPLTLRVWTGYEDRMNSRLVITIPAGDVVRSDSVALDSPVARAS